MNELLKVPQDLNPSDGQWSVLHPEFAGTCCAFSRDRDGTFLAVGGAKGRIALFDFSTIPVLVKVLAPPASVAHGQPAVAKAVHRLSWAHNNRILVAAHPHGVLTVWDVVQGALCHTVVCGAPVGSLHCLQRWRQDQCVVLLAAAQPCLRLLNLRTGAWEDSRAPVIQLVVQDALAVPRAGPSDTTDAAAAATPPGVAQPLLPPASAPRVSGCLAPDERRVFVLDGRGELAAYDVAAGTRLVVVSFGVPFQHPYLHISDDGAFMLATSAAGVRLLDTNTLETLCKYRDAVNNVAFGSCCFGSSGGSLAAAAEPASGVTDAATGPPMPPRAVVAVPASDACDQLYVFGVSSSDPGMRVIAAPRNGVSSVAWHPRRPLLAACMRRGSVHVLCKEYQSGWPGPMYPPGFEILENNAKYVEHEDEFDLVGDQTAVGRGVDEASSKVDVGVDAPQFVTPPSRGEDALALPVLTHLPVHPEADEGDSMAGSPEEEGARGGSVLGFAALLWQDEDAGEGGEGGEGDEVAGEEEGGAADGMPVTVTGDERDAGADWAVMEPPADSKWSRKRARGGGVDDVEDQQLGDGDETAGKLSGRAARRGSTRRRTR